MFFTDLVPEFFLLQWKVKSAAGYMQSPRAGRIYLAQAQTSGSINGHLQCLLLACLLDNTGAWPKASGYASGKRLITLTVSYSADTSKAPFRLKSFISLAQVWIQVLWNISLCLRHHEIHRQERASLAHWTALDYHNSRVVGLSPSPGWCVSSLHVFLVWTQ